MKRLLVCFDRPCLTTPVQGHRPWMVCLFITCLIHRADTLIYLLGSIPPVPRPLRACDTHALTLLNRSAPVGSVFMIASTLRCKVIQGLCMCDCPDTALQERPNKLCMCDRPDTALQKRLIDFCNFDRFDSALQERPNGLCVRVAHGCSQPYRGGPDSGPVEGYCGRVCGTPGHHHLRHRVPGHTSPRRQRILSVSCDPLHSHVSHETRAWGSWAHCNLISCNQSFGHTATYLFEIGFLCTLHISCRTDIVIKHHFGLGNQKYGGNYKCGPINTRVLLAGVCYWRLKSRCLRRSLLRQ